MQNYINNVANTTGDAIVGATVTVLKSDGTVPTLYAANGSSPLPSNILTTDKTGEYSFFAANGTYTIAVASPGFTGQTNTGIVLFDPADASAVPGGSVTYKFPGTGTVARTMQSAVSDKPITPYDMGAIGDNVHDDSGAINSALALATLTGRSVLIPYTANGWLCKAPIVQDRCRVYGDNSTINFQSLASNQDCWTIQGSVPQARAELEGIVLNCAGTGQHGLRMTGGGPSGNRCDHAVVSRIYILSPVLDGLHLESTAAAYWFQNCRFTQIKVYTPGRHGRCIILPNLAGLFANNFTWTEFEVRGAGQTAALNGVDYYCDMQGTNQQISAHKEIVGESDTQGSPNHAQLSWSLNMSGGGTGCGYYGWSIDTTIIEDTGTTITGFPIAIQLGAGITPAQVSGWTCFGYNGAKYGQIVDFTKFQNYLFISAAGGRSAISIDGPISGTGFKPGGSALSDLNTIDRYARAQTITPTITLGGAAVGVTYGTQYGYWQQIGDTIYFRGRIVLTSKGSSTGALLIVLTGMPGIADAASPPVAMFGQNFAAGITAPPMGLIQGGPVIKVFKMSAGAAVQLADTDLANNSDVAYFGSYHV